MRVRPVDLLDDARHGLPTVLDHVVGVRIPASQPDFTRVDPLASFVWASPIQIIRERSERARHSGEVCRAVAAPVPCGEGGLLNPPLNSDFEFLSDQLHREEMALDVDKELTPVKPGNLAVLDPRLRHLMQQGAL